jgi:hypothetical protein
MTRRSFFNYRRRLGLRQRDDLEIEKNENEESATFTGAPLQAVPTNQSLESPLD